MGGNHVLVYDCFEVHVSSLFEPPAQVGGFCLGVRLMRRILIQSYPNREIRVTTVREQVSRGKTNESHDETEGMTSSPSPPTCHSLKTLKGSENTQQKGLLQIDGEPGWGGLPRFQRFSTYARRQILRAGGALERSHPHQECLFLTLTLPGSTKVSFEAMARYSAMAVQRLKSWIGWRIKSNLSIYTWEWQKRGALHLHYVVHCADKEIGEYIRSHLKEQWIRILDSISEASGVDMYRKHAGFSWVNDKDSIRVDAQWCEKSVAAYLSKYVSKPKGEGEFRKTFFYCPSRWYGVSRPLLQLLREMTFKCTFDNLNSSEAWGRYEDCLSLLQAWALKCYDYKHKVGDGRTTVAYCNTNEQDSIWNDVMNLNRPNPDSSMNTELKLKRLARNGTSLMMKHPTWLASFTQFCASTHIYKVMKLPSYKDITRNDLLFLVDMLAYSFRYTQRTRFELPGACKLWYSQTSEVITSAPENDKEWIGALKL